MHTIKSKKLLMLKPEQIRIPCNAVRKNSDTKKIKKLEQSITVNGIIEPLAVRRDEAGFILVAGQRRLLAAKSVGLRRVPCVLYELDTKESLLYSVMENLQREPLDPFDEAQTLGRLVTYGSFSHIQVAERLGLTAAQLSDKLSLLDLDTQITNRLSSAGLSIEFAKLLLILPRYQREDVLNSIIDNNLNLQQSRELVELKINPPTECEDLQVCENTESLPEHKPIRKYAIGDERMFYNSLAKLTDTLRSAGFGVTTRKTENDKYTEYKVRIKKETSENSEYKQLKIC